MKSNVSRDKMLAELKSQSLWDVVVIGGGAMGSGIAVDAAARGFKTLLIEAQDFSAGSSSRSTKIINGGLRDINNPKNWKSIAATLKERKLLLENAPHIVHRMPFIIPCYQGKEKALFMSVMSLYSALSAGNSIGKTKWLRAEEVIRKLPEIRAKGLKGGVQFWDGIFDDARLNIALVKTAEKLGATVLNYFPVRGFVTKTNGEIEAVKAIDEVSGEKYKIRTRMVFNATGAWVDQIRQMVKPTASPTILLSRGSHIVVSQKYFEGDTAIMVAKPKERKVVFCIPYNGMVEFGIANVKEEEPSFEPSVREEEKDYLVKLAKEYIEFPFDKSAIKASFTGLRVMVNPNASVGLVGKNPQEYAIATEFKNMVSVIGGRWSSYRKIAEDAMTQAVEAGLIYKRPCATAFLSILRPDKFNPDEIEKALVSGKNVEEKVLDYARYCQKEEYALTADDFLQRRLKIGVMNEAVTEKLRPKVEEIFG